MSDKYGCPICKEYFYDRSQWMDINNCRREEAAKALCEYWHQGYPKIILALEKINKKLDRMETSSSPTTRQEAEKASELRWACAVWEKEKKGTGIFIKHFGPISDTRCNSTQLYVEARKWLEEYDEKRGVEQ